MEEQVIGEYFDKSWSCILTNIIQTVVLLLACVSLNKSRSYTPFRTNYSQINNISLLKILPITGVRKHAVIINSVNPNLTPMIRLVHIICTLHRPISVYCGYKLYILCKIIFIGRKYQQYLILDLVLWWDWCSLLSANDGQSEDLWCQWCRIPAQNQKYVVSDHCWTMSFLQAIGVQPIKHKFSYSVFVNYILSGVNISIY